MKFVCNLLLLFAAFSGSAQITRSVEVQSKPLGFVFRALHPVQKSPMKSMIWMRANDTLKSYRLDKGGNVLAEVEYKHNKQISSALHTYEDTLRTSTVLTTTSAVITTTYTYTPAGKLASAGNITKYTNKEAKPMADDFTWMFDYDDKGNVIRMYGANAANKLKSSEFKYDVNNRLQKKVNDNGWQDVYEYDAKGQLLMHREMLKNETSDYFKYVYDTNGNLTKLTLKQFSVDYTYLNNRLVKCIYHLFGGKKEIVDFVYRDDVLAEVNVQREATWTYTPFELKEEYIPYIAKFRIEFLYDEYNNTKELRYILNGEYKYSEKFTTEYYK